MDVNAVTNAIALAVAPVFMLTAVASLIGALAARLSRIIDRARVLEERLDTGTIKNQDEVYGELDRLKVRARVVSFSVGLLTLSGALIGATVMALFLGETTAFHIVTLVPWSFLGGVLCFVFALLCFLTETLLATYVLNFKQRPGK